MSADPMRLTVGEDTHEDGVEKKFLRLRDEWKSQRGPHSATAQLAMHPAYQKIIGMGPEAMPVPLPPRM